MYQLGIGGIKKKSYVFSGFDNSISCGWERKSTTGRFITGQFFRLSEIFLLSVRTDSMNENSVIMIQSIFPSWALAPTHCVIFMRELLIPLFLVWLDTSPVHCAHSRATSLNSRSKIPYLRVPCIILSIYDDNNYKSKKSM